MYATFSTQALIRITYLFVLAFFCLNFWQSALANDGAIKFIENKKQWDTPVKFVADIPGGRIFLSPQAFAYSFSKSNAYQHGHFDDVDSLHNPALRTNINLPANPTVVNRHNVIVAFAGANENPFISGETPTSEFYNYFLGNDPKRWSTHVSAYREVTYQELYDGIDFKIYSNEFNQLKYDFIVDAKTNPNQIELIYSGAELSIENGKLIIQTSLGEIVEQKPLAYQIVDGKKKEIMCEFQLQDNKVSFYFPEGYNNDAELIIDPLLIFSTFSGSFADNWGNTATFDDDGNLYSGGIVENSGNRFPTTSGAFQETNGGNWDVGILKYDSAGSQLIYATYIGGASMETPHSLIVRDNELFVYGTTSSPNFPVSNSAYQDTLNGGPEFYPFDSYGGIFYPNGSDLFIIKLNTTGSDMVASTLLGGTNNDGVNYFNSPLTRNYGDQFRGDINTDSQGNVYVASNTASTDFPIVNGVQPNFGGGDQDGVVFKLSPDLSQLLWSSFFGGSFVDAAFSIKLDSAENLYITGGTGSPNLPTTASAYHPNLSGGIDGFAAVLNIPNDSIVACTYVGTSDYDQAYFIDIDQDQNVYLLGQTRGNYPIEGNVYSNQNSGQFIHKLNSNLSATLFSTTFGSSSGSPDISPTAFLVNECGNILVSGWGGNVNATYISVSNQVIQRNYVGGSTRNLPVTEDADQAYTNGSDFYLMVLEKDAASLLYATFFGGNSASEHVDGGTSRFDRKGIVYQSVCGGCGGYSDFPTTEDAWSNVNNSRNCNNVAFKYDLTTLEARLATNSPEGDQPGLNQGCFPLTVMFLNRSIGGESFLWDLGDGTITDQADSIIHTFDEPGEYPIKLTAYDENTCLKEDYDYGTITVFDVAFNVIDSLNICYGESVQLLAEGGIQYEWSPAQHIDDPSSANPNASPDTTSTYTVNITDQNGCTYEDSVRIDVVPEIVMDFNVIRNYSCEPNKEVTIENNITGAEEIIWDFGDGNTSTEANPIHIYTDSGTYQVQVTATSQQCTENRRVPVEMADLFIPNVLTPNNDGDNDTFQILYNTSIGVKIFNRWGKLLYENQDYDNKWDGDELSGGVYYYEVSLPNEEPCKGWVHLMK